MARIIDYYFAPISGYAYLGHKGLMSLASETGATVNFKPLLIAKVFAAADTTPPFAQSDARKSYRISDQKRFADKAGLVMNAVPEHWPTDPSLGCRVILAAGKLDTGKLGANQDAATFACLKAVWAQNRNIADPDDLASALTEAGLPAAELLTAAEHPDIATQMTGITEEAIKADVFGSPTYVVDGERFWGQDRLDFLREAVLTG